jgi:hypothetical protein
MARSVLASYLGLFRTRQFLAYALVAAGAHAGFHIFAAGAPAVLIGGFGIRPEEYGYYASLPPIGFLVGSFVSNRLSPQFGIDAMIRPSRAEAVLDEGRGPRVFGSQPLSANFNVVRARGS